MNILLVFVGLLFSLSNTASATDKSAHALQDVTTGNHIIIMRHALAPGTGDPDNFELGQCNTQRNLSDKGRHQAKRIGENLKRQGIVNAAVYTSQWCRCVDTATALNVGTTQEQPLLNSFYARRDVGPEQIKKLKQWLVQIDEKKPEENRPIILVSHQVVITALTGVYPSSGDAVVIKVTDENNIEVVRQIKAN